MEVYELGIEIFCVVTEKYTCKNCPKLREESANTGVIKAHKSNKRRLIFFIGQKTNKERIDNRNLWLLFKTTKNWLMLENT